MSNTGETYEERQFREHAEHEAWLEGALTRLDSGLQGEDKNAALQRLAAYMRTQIAEDQAAWADYAAWVDREDEGEPTPRTTRMQDRSGLELALMLLAGKG